MRFNIDIFNKATFDDTNHTNFEQLTFDRIIIFKY